MAVAVTNSTISALNVDQTFTANAATADGVNGTEVFTITPTKAGGKILIAFTNGAGHGAVTYSIASGDFWASVGAITGSIAAGATEILQIETAKFKKAAGTILITMAPATGKILLTNHAFSMAVAELI